MEYVDCLISKLARFIQLDLLHRLLQDFLGSLEHLYFLLDQYFPVAQFVQIDPADLEVLVDRGRQLFLEDRKDPGFHSTLMYFYHLRLLYLLGDPEIQLDQLDQSLRFLPSHRLFQQIQEIRNDQLIQLFQAHHLVQMVQLSR